MGTFAIHSTAVAPHLPKDGDRPAAQRGIGGNQALIRLRRRESDYAIRHPRR